MPSRYQLVPAVLALALLSGCRGTPQQREAYFLQRAKKDAGARDYRKAVIEFKVASQNMPKDPEPVYLLGMTYLSTGSGRLALEAFQKVTVLDPRHEGAQYQLALFKLGSRKREMLLEAKQSISVWIASHPNDAEAIAYLGLAEAKLENKPEAIRLLEAGAMKDASSLHVAGTAIAVYTARGDVESAREVARDLADKLPNSPEAATLRAQVSLAMKDIADADAEISRALSLNRDFRPALLLRLRREMTTGEAGNAEATTQELSRLPEKKMWGAFARVLFSENKTDRGIVEYERALKEHSNDIQLRDEYASMLLVADRRKEAETVAGGTLAKNPKDVDALMVRAILEINRGDLDSAAKDVRSLRELKAFSAQLSYQESRIFAARGDRVREGDLLAEALRRDPRLLGARLELSRLFVSSGKAKEALVLLDQAPAALKRTTEYIYYRNMALFAAGDWEEARKSVDRALAISRSPGFLYQDALVRSRGRDLDGARKSLEAAFQVAPADPATLNLLGDIMRRQREFPEYVAMVKEAAAKNGGSAVLQYATGRLLEEQGDLAGARAAFDAARADGDIVDAENEIALLELRSGSVDKARERLMGLVKDHDNARARISLAEIEKRRGGDAPVEHYLKAIQLEPGNVLAMNNLAAYLAMNQKKYDDALFWAQKALALTPDSPASEDTVGWTYYLAGKYDLALPLLEKSAKGLDRPLAHYHLAAGFLKTGDPGRAKKEYEVAVKEDPKSTARSTVGNLFETGKGE
jgi:tetratricopeptide (TPR) repeat protein